MIDYSVLKELFEPSRLKFDEELLRTYGQDMTEDLVFVPNVVFLPESVEEVQAMVKWCNANKVPITTRGAGTGLSGGALPVNKGVLLSMEKMNSIVEIDTQNQQVTVETGIINQVMRDAVEEHGLFYPPDPASRGSCFIGGNIAHNSGGPKAVKYGVTKDYVLNLEVVMADGSVLWTGADTLKNSTGYSLTQLMVGSEGTLGVITKAVLKLIALPKHSLLMWVNFKSAKDACKAVSIIMVSGVTPSGLELMERKGVELACSAHNMASPIGEGYEAALLIEVDGNNLDNLYLECEEIAAVLENYETDEILFADTAAHKENWWKIRRSIGEVVKAHSVYKEEDTVVKRAYLADLLEGVKRIGDQYNFESVCYGHAGDGNLHVNILKNDLTDEEWNGPHLEEGIREIFRLCKSLGGTISGEHGIGYVQKRYMNEVLSDAHIRYMKAIKQALDPDNILNPGKIFD